MKTLIGGLVHMHFQRGDFLGQSRDLFKQGLVGGVPGAGVGAERIRII